MVYQLNIQTIPLTRRSHLIVRVPVADTAAWVWLDVVALTSKSAGWTPGTRGGGLRRCEVLGNGLLVRQVQTRWMTTGVLRSPAES